MAQKLTLILILGLLLNACASRPCARLAPQQSICLAAMPAAPVFALRREQVIATTPQGRQAAINEIEWSGQKLHVLALTFTGQSLYELGYDGRAIQWQRGVFPFALPPENILLDLQWIWWPPKLLRARLPAGWSLQEYEANGQRFRSYNDAEGLIAVITYHGNAEQASVDFVQERLHYRLQLTALEE